MLFSAMLHAAVIGFTLLVPNAAEKHKVIELIEVSVTTLPGYAGGGGKSEEPVPPKKPEKEIKPEPEPVKVAPRRVEIKKAEPKKKIEPEKPEVAKVVRDLPKGPGQGPAGGGDQRQADITGPVAIAGGVNFPYSWYLKIIQDKVTRNWTPPLVSGRNISRPVIYFNINRDGSVTDIKLQTSSGNGLLDRSALSAITALKRIDRLPAGFAGDSLGVQYMFVTQAK